MCRDIEFSQQRRHCNQILSTADDDNAFSHHPKQLRKDHIQVYQPREGNAAQKVPKVEEALRLPLAIPLTYLRDYEITDLVVCVEIWAVFEGSPNKHRNMFNCRVSTFENCVMSASIRAFKRSPRWQIKGSHEINLSLWIPHHYLGNVINPVIQQGI